MPFTVNLTAYQNYMHKHHCVFKYDSYGSCEMNITLLTVLCHPTDDLTLL